jgi:hypothetical protein
MVIMVCSTDLAGQVTDDVNAHSMTTGNTDRTKALIHVLMEAADLHTRWARIQRDFSRAVYVGYEFRQCRGSEHQPTLKF